MQQITLELPMVDLDLLKSLVDRFGWKAVNTGSNYADSVSPSGDEWWNVEENVRMVREGCAQLERGEGVALSSDEVRSRLGL
ncbi:MAG: hypothetical protein HUK04_06120 [Bacteroidaceae bacterium]|nr:hypothetical protein [Bacteroidaceae bacterium]